MNHRLAIIAGMTLTLLATAPPGMAQTSCPEVEAAKKAYGTRLAAVSLKDDDVQAPRSLAAARSGRGEAARAQQDVQAPRTGPKPEDIQAPRGKQDIQAPRAQQDVQAPRIGPKPEDIQAPRGKQDTQAPRAQQDVQAPRTATIPKSLVQSKALIAEAEAACAAGKTAEAARKAKSALGLLKG